VKKGQGRKSRPESPAGPRAGSGQRPLAQAPRRLLTLLADQPEPLTLAAVARATGLHPNTVREHLDTLVRRGLVSRSKAAAIGRGRPAWRYAAVATDVETPEYSGLASALAGVIARTSPSPAEDAAIAGEEWGRDLVRGRGGGGTSEDARDSVVEMLDDLGFAPTADPDEPSRIRLTRCPLLEAAHRHPEVVCAVHLGIVRGALASQGADPTGTELRPFAEPGACVLVVPPLAGA
jgi:predicted ArsR family transcriptional regulator